MTTVTLVLDRVRNERRFEFGRAIDEVLAQRSARPSWNSTSTAGQKTESGPPDLPPALAAAEIPSAPPQILLPHSTDESSAYTPPMKSAVRISGEKDSKVLSTQ